MEEINKILDRHSPVVLRATERNVDKYNLTRTSLNYAIFFSEILDNFFLQYFGEQFKPNSSKKIKITKKNFCARI